MMAVHPPTWLVEQTKIPATAKNHQHLPALTWVLKNTEITYNMGAANKNIHCSNLTP